MPKALVTFPLNISDVHVLEAEINKVGELIIIVESTKSEAIFRQCGRVIRKFHGHDDWVTLRYLPVFGRPTYLRYRP